jgi:hypothetical protein
MYGGADFTLKREADPKKRFSVQIRTPVSFEIRALLKNLEENITQQRKEKDEKDVDAGEATGLAYWSRGVGGPYDPRDP